MSAVDETFLDTNILVYAHDRSETVKGPQARTLLIQLLAAGRPLLSIQVFSEFYWTATRKLPMPLTHDEAIAEMARLKVLSRIVPVTLDILEQALQTVAAHGVSLWDGQIHAAAKLNGATRLLSEDFQHRQTLEGVTFLNPFASDFDIAEILSA